jgi:hypothetical protein
MDSDSLAVVKKESRVAQITIRDLLGKDVTQEVDCKLDVRMTLASAVSSQHNNPLACSLRRGTHGGFDVFATPAFCGLYEINIAAIADLVLGSPAYWQVEEKQALKNSMSKIVCAQEFKSAKCLVATKDEVHVISGSGGVLIWDQNLKPRGNWLLSQSENMTSGDMHATVCLCSGVVNADNIVFSVGPKSREPSFRFQFREQEVSQSHFLLY